MRTRSQALFNKCAFQTQRETSRCREEWLYQSSGECTRMKTKSRRAHVARARRPHSQTLAARQNSVILCLEDRRRSSDLWPLLRLWGAFFPLWRWWLISVIYIAAPGGSSTGFTHLSFPLHCFSNGDEIECIAPWVCLPATLLCIEGTARKCICW